MAGRSTAERAWQMVLYGFNGLDRGIEFGAFDKSVRVAGGGCQEDDR